MVRGGLPEGVVGEVTETRAACYPETLLQVETPAMPNALQHNCGPWRHSKEANQARRMEFISQGRQTRLETFPVAGMGTFCKLRLPDTL